SRSLTCSVHTAYHHSFPTRRSSDLPLGTVTTAMPVFNTSDFASSVPCGIARAFPIYVEVTVSLSSILSIYFLFTSPAFTNMLPRSEEHTSELQSRFDLVCRLLLEKT